MALATTTLSAAVAADDNKITVASATSIAVGRLLVIDQEVFQVDQSWVSGTTIPVLRGRMGSATAAHVVTANVTHGLASDFANPVAQSSINYATQRAVKLVSVTASSSLALPAAGSDLRVVLNGTAAITLTVPVPTKDLDGAHLVILANGAAAHVLTFTGGLGGAGGSYDVLTLNGTGPAAFEAYACNGLWIPMIAVAMTGTVTNITGALS